MQRAASDADDLVEGRSNLLGPLMREALIGHQRQSEAITRGLELLELLMREAIRGHQRQSPEALSCWSC
jgi:hypothetical protein